MGSTLRLSIIVPTWNEAPAIAEALSALQPLRGAGHELIVADGQSQDATVAVARPLADHVLVSACGRARQMNAGAAQASGEVLLFLHADTRLPAGADVLVRHALESAGRDWGRFDVRLSGTRPLLRLVERMMNLRSRLTGIATGDQALFVRHDLFRAVGGFPDIPLMEDIVLSTRLKRHGRPACLHEAVVTSSRRWEQQGILRTILLMWRLRLAFTLGADPHRLVNRYYRSFGH